MVLGSVALMSSIAAPAAAAEPPSIDKESVSGVTSTNAILEAQISPHSEEGAQVQFQLVTNPEEFASEIYCPYPPEPGPLCLGEYAEGALPILNPFKELQLVRLNLSEDIGVTLTPNTTYHYRVLAARAIFGEDTIQWEPPIVIGSDQTFTTLGEVSVPLTIAKIGEGTVTSSPAGIECTGAKTGAECEHAFELNEMVTLTASPASGYAFSAWAGCTEHAGLTCKVKMEKAKTVKVSFVATPSLTVEKAGTGYGKVSATGISCDESCSKESSAVKTGTSVTVKTTPAKGNEAAVIEGGTGSASACSGSTCTFTIEANSSLKVKFSPIPSKTLTVKLTGPGAYKGKVSGKGTTVKGLVSTAILCGTGCTTETESFFATGTTELVASTVTGYKFAGWTVSGGSAGSCTGTTSPCTLLTDANKTVEAKFE
jgi:hypothetical protein